MVTTRGNAASFSGGAAIVAIGCVSFTHGEQAPSTNRSNLVGGSAVTVAP